jgi:hypothetical protein
MKYLPFLLLILAATSAAGQTTDTMKVRLKSGAIVPYAVSSVDALSFSGVQGKDTLNVNLKSGTTVLYSVSLVDKVDFSGGLLSDSILIGLKGGMVKSYPVASISSLTFIDWDKSSSIETLTPESVTACFLGQNFPNPFYRSTTIPYFLPVRQYVSVGVYSLDAQLIVSLVQENMGEGMHQVTWDASEIPEGIYVCRLKTAGSLMTKKLILLKD